MSEEILVTASSGNVLADLGINNAEKSLAKGKIANCICELINEAQLSLSLELIQQRLKISQQYFDESWINNQEDNNNE